MDNILRDSDNAMTLVERMQSYKNFPRNDLDKLELSVIDQYYTQLEDQTRCVHCLKLQSNWNPKGAYILQHHKVNQDCPAVQCLLSPILTFYLGEVGIIKELRQARVKRLSKQLLLKSFVKKTNKK